DRPLAARHAAREPRAPGRARARARALRGATPAPPLRGRAPARAAARGDRALLLRQPDLLRDRRRDREERPDRQPAPGAGALGAPRGARRRARMTMSTSERLHAYLDGELSREERAALEAELARDPELRARLAELRELDGELRELYAAETKSAEPSLVNLRPRLPEPRHTLPWLLVPLAAAAGFVAGLWLRGGSE